mmetsp:Transcript_15780/g.34153  ORF Transcript_15780/g.34153 Transcript_15780/m.34153 type:complete len:935 (+) Transcript_15780:205-3009(+)|eukprot:CAMPEP_0172320466 /NCGR_PEP_ID=MMETSP1058-20130122/40643_1 /TAXON_ID=83371 /ORGANISM="Detonula confervacea, Strain CCMP 353" /LENGTH=934 /DNA_ID=CAMNT_0013035741 /DNA_START=48 /DNA_END=2852 /DNA_ORIENTATION=+
MTSFVNDNLPVPPPSIKPTSRARTYRIPNTSDAAAAGALAGTNSNIINADNDNGNNIWATREIAALDFLMNVPLKSEKDIVRAGLSGGRWHRHQNRQHPTTPTEQNNLNFSSRAEVIEEENTPNIRNLNSFDITRSSGIEDEGGRLSEATTTGTESSIHTMSLVSEHNKSQAAAAGGRWWDKLVLKDKRFFSVANQQAQRREQLELEEKELERPTESPSLVMTNSVAGGSNGVRFGTVAMNAQNKGNIGTNMVAAPSSANAAGGVPGRRLDGIEAVTITIPDEFRRRPPPLRAVARQAAVREWEIKVAYGAQQDLKQQPQQPGNNSNKRTRKALLDGRVFFASHKSYPMAVFSTIKYEPKKEEALRRRKQLEELGGGRIEMFVLPERDWRGISYRALLPQVETQNKAFNRLLGGNTSPPEKRKKKKRPSSPRDRDHFDNTSSSCEDDDDITSVSSSEESAAGYFPGFLDDPLMLQGRNRNVMMGDKVTGPIISSTIQFRKPVVLKAYLNKQFRERFDQWEPPKSQRKYIGAKVIDGVYTLIDTTETMQEDVDVDGIGGRHLSGSIAAEHERETIRMPPSLTLSKIRSLKQQALRACVRARIEISTLALACIYFERLCLDCRVDKSNRRLSFAACLLLAVKVNESNSMIAYDRGTETKSDGTLLPLMTSWVKPNKKSGKIFESLIVFFTHDWSLSLKQLYAAEWIVFTALGFSLKAKPSEVAFHFKRLLRVLEWNPRSYLGSEMYGQWKESLMEESHQNERRKARRELQIKRNERKLLKLQQKLHMQQIGEEASGHSSRRSSTTISEVGVSQNRNRRRSTDSHLSSVGLDAKSSVSVHSHKSQEDRPRKTRGILSRLSRPKQAIASYGKELDKLPKLEKKDVACPIKQSVSVPNLSSLDSETNDFFIDFNIHEGDNESSHSDHSKGEEDDEGLFI